MPIYMSETERQELRTRMNKWLMLVLGAFVLLLIRFWILQVVQNDIWSFIANNNQIRKSTIPAMRGNIYDRRHQLLADWRQSFNVTITPADIKANSAALAVLSSIIGVTPEEIRARMERNRSWSRYIPVLVAEDIPWEQFARVEENRLRMPGVGTEIRPVRKYYPDSVLCSHVLGYMGEINREELERPEYREYRMGDRLGRSGLERSLELAIRGRDGITHQLVDAFGRELSAESIPQELRDRLDLGEKLSALKAMSRPVEPGKSVVLTLDLNFQRIVRDNFGDYNGAAVVMDVHTGEILVLFSTPGYDPSIFIDPISPATWKELSEDPRHPLLNRAVQGTYPPGSVFKIIMAAAGLQERIVTPNTTFFCGGSFTINDAEFRCWNRMGHGSLNLEEALIESCDVYFYNLGERLGVERIAKWARKFGMGVTVGEGLPEEKAGLVPDPAWKWRYKKRRWYPGETISLSIGQGYLTATPLQVVLIPAAVANSGTLMRPQLIHHFEDVLGKPISKFTPQIMGDQLFSRDTEALLRRAMEKVVQDPRGTAYRYVRSDFIAIAGKTGTSEVSGSKRYQGRPLEEIPYHYRDHAWFVAYAPAADPEFAMAVIVEHGGGGGAVAGALTKKILEDYYFFRAAELGGPGPPG